jgi:hypothetical protein
MFALHFTPNPPFESFLKMILPVNKPTENIEAAPESTSAPEEIVSNLESQFYFITKLEIQLEHLWNEWSTYILKKSFTLTDVDRLLTAFENNKLDPRLQDWQYDMVNLQNNLLDAIRISKNHGIDLRWCKYLTSVIFFGLVEQRKIEWARNELISLRNHLETLIKPEDCRVSIPESLVKQDVYLPVSEDAGNGSVETDLESRPSTAMRIEKWNERLQIDLDCNQATLDGKNYPNLTDDEVQTLKLAQDNYPVHFNATAENLRVFRIKKQLAKKAPALAAIILSEPGRGTTLADPFAN